jgi:hypothetical protein
MQAEIARLRELLAGLLSAYEEFHARYDIGDCQVAIDARVFLAATPEQPPKRDLCAEIASGFDALKQMRMNEPPLKWRERAAQLDTSRPFLEGRAHSLDDCADELQAVLIANGSDKVKRKTSDCALCHGTLQCLTDPSMPWSATAYSMCPNCTPVALPDGGEVE